MCCQKHQKDTSINERRFVEEVQGGIINTDEDGLSNLKYKVRKTERLFNTKHEMIDFEITSKVPSRIIEEL